MRAYRAGMSLSVTWLGHSTVVVDIDGVRLVVDPLVQRHAGILRRRGTQPMTSNWAGADAVLISHLHHDHAEVGSLRFFRELPMYMAPANAKWARGEGFDGRGLEEGEWAALGPEGAVEVRLVKAVHNARPMPHRPNAANGHLIRGPSGVTWIAGDTELFPEMADLPKLAGADIDIAIVPIGGWGPRLSAGHLGPEEAAVACAMSGAKWAVPVHWQTLHLPAGRAWPRGWMDAAGPLFEFALARTVPSCHVAMLQPGESLTLPGDHGER